MNTARIAAEIEHIEAEAWAQLHLALAPALRDRLHCEVARHGEALSVRTAGADAPSGNRTIGLGLERELNEDQLREIVSWYADAGIKRWLLEWSPEARPVVAEGWFAQHGGRAMTPTLKLWRKLDGGVQVLDRSGLTVVEIGTADAAAFEKTVADPLGVPPAMASVVRSTVGHEHWHFYLALDGTRPVAGAAMFVHGEGAWFGLSATVSSDRNRGAQTALLARRLRDAQALGCAWVSADTQADTPERPNPSYRNMRRAGMDILYARAKYLFQISLGGRGMKPSKNDRQIDYVEFVVHDIAKTKAFYGDVFGWRFKDYGPDYCEFRDGRLTGGFTTEGTPRPGGPLVVLYGDDLPSLSKLVQRSGGKISKPIFDFPGGQRFHFVDPNGYELAVWTKAPA